MTDETKRDRVRRLLIDPLKERGMRFRRGTAEAEAQRSLDGLCDDLAYMGDERLKALAECLRSKGEGKERCFWPPRVTVLSYAEAFQPRPIEELPAMASWLGSVEGPKAAREGSLISVFMFIQRTKRPPVSEQDRRVVQSRAHQHRSDMALWRDKRDRGVARADELEGLRYFEDIERRAMALVKAGQTKRAAQGVTA